MTVSGVFHARGFHPSSACGVFGAAVASARLGGLDARRRRARSASPAACPRACSRSSTRAPAPSRSMPAGPRTAACSPRGSPPTAARGQAACSRVGSGSTRPSRASRVRPVSPHSSPTSASAGRPSGSHTSRIPACHYMHGSLGATASLLDELSPDEIDAIDEIAVTVPPGAVEVVCEPESEKRSPRSDYEAKFSIQYSTAAMLVERRVNLDTYSHRAPRRPRPRRARGQGSLRGQAATRRPRRVPRRRHGSACATAACSRPTSPTSLGRPENPLSEPQVRAKFRDNAALALAPSAVDALEDADLQPRGSRRPARRLLAPRGRARRGLMASTLSSDQREVIDAVRAFVERDVMPVASDYEHADEYPTALVEHDARARPVRGDDPRASTAGSGST